ncbi:MAG: hypothetical protein CML03_01885 [Pseudooceanicola sp.]|mgnify:CR=1 FL=1|nr:hypothetical protein [Pseudooceanicola sp.]
MAPTTNRNLTIFAGEFPARSETFVRNHAAGFAQRGWRVEVMSSQPGESMSQTELAEVDAMGVTRSYWGAWSPSSAGRALQFAGELMRAPGLVAVLNGAGGWTRPEMFAGHRMRRLLRQSPTGPVHVHYGKYAALLVAAGWPGPAIVTWHGFDANIVPKLRGDGIYRDLFAKDWVHTVGSSFVQRRLVALGARPDRIVKIPMGVDFERFVEIDRSGWAARPLAVVSVGRLSEEKGHAVLLDAAAEVNARGTDLRLTIIGEGPARPVLERQIRDLGLGARVLLLGSQPPARVVRELAAADVFALPGVTAGNGSEETQGLAYIEAQATGLPVIASDVGGVSESLDPGRSGILTAERDVKAVADALVAYAEHPDLRYDHGRQGAAFVRAKFTQAAMLDAFERLYAGEAA